MKYTLNNCDNHLSGMLIFNLDSFWNSYGFKINFMKIVYGNVVVGTTSSVGIEKWDWINIKTVMVQYVNAALIVKHAYC